MGIMKEVVQEERLLHLCLYASSKIDDEEDFTRSIADELIIGYILDEFQKAGKEEFDESDVTERYSDLMTDWVLTKHVQDGNIEVDLSGDEPLYKLTKQGKDYADRLGEDGDTLHGHD